MDKAQGAKSKYSLLMPFSLRIAITEEEQRLIAASLPILPGLCIILSIFFSHLYTLDIGKTKQQNTQEKVYPVLIQQAEQYHKSKAEMAAYAKKESGGRGGVTARYGFHHLSPYDSLEIPSQASNIKGSHNSKKRALGGPQKQSKRTAKTKSKSKAKAYRIPSNYRFRRDFLFRFDGSSYLSIASRKLAGFQYFRRMLQQIKENFSPPGINYVARDYAGYVLNQTIAAQTVLVAFALDRDGNVSDVRKISSIGQALVDEACLNTLKGQNFGKAPPEIFERGNVFGIQFIFPDLRY